MPPELNLEEERAVSQHLKVQPLYLALLAPFIIVGLLYAFIPSLRDGLGALIHPVEEQVVVDDTVDVIEHEPSGTITLSLTPHTDTRFASRSLYTYNTESGDLEKVLHSDTQDYFEPGMSTDGTQIVFGTAPTSGATPNESLLYGDPAFEELLEVTPPKEVMYVRTPSFSPDGTHIAFVGAGKSVTTFGEIEGQHVYLYNTEDKTTERIIMNAVNPVFTPDGQLMVLTADGVHLMNLTENTDELVLPSIEYPFDGYDSFALSSDGTQIALALQSRRAVVVYSIQSYAPFTPELTHTYDTYASGAAFSPDGNYLALIEFNVDETQKPFIGKNPRLIIFDLVNEGEAGFMPLSNFYPQLITIGGWH